MDEMILDPMPQTQQPDPEGLLQVVDVAFRTGTKVYFFDPGDLELSPGTQVIIDTARGVEFGTCASGVHSVSVREVVQPLRSVLRVASPGDIRMAEENWGKEKAAFDICLQKIAEQGLEMQLVSAEYAFDGSKILFFFTADGRVDFRELVKSLAAVFHTRIELRQIGVRDKAKLIGGLGVCGRPFCCSEFLEEFQPVSIKMAKVQNLSLNPTKISGTCGRLMCCLKYEQEAYEDLLRQSPRNESFVDTPDGRGTVTEVNLLRQSVKVRMEEHPEEVNCYRNCDICVLRSGKAHKNDPPIPKEVAPISGNRERKTKLSTTATGYEALEPVIIRSMPEEEEPKAAGNRRKKRGEEKARASREAAPNRPEKEGGEKEGSRRRKGKGKGGHPERPEGEKPQKAPRPEGDKPQKNHNRGPRNHGGKPKGAKPPQPEGSAPQKAPRPEGEKGPRPEGEGKSHNRRRPPRNRRKPQAPNQE